MVYPWFSFQMVPCIDVWFLNHDIQGQPIICYKKWYALLENTARNTIGKTTLKGAKPIAVTTNVRLYVRIYVTIDVSIDVITDLSKHVTG